MPIQRCKVKGIPGWRWGIKGKCYTGKNAKQKAINQALAITKGKLEDVKKDSEITVNNFKQALFYKREGMGKNNRVKNIPKGKKWLYPYSIERTYNKFIRDVMKQFSILMKLTIRDNLEKWMYEVKLFTDDFNSEMGNSMGELQDLDTYIFEDNINEIETELYIIALKLFEYNEKQFVKVTESITHIKPILNEPWKDTMIRSWVNENVSLIRGLDQEYLKNISRIVNGGFNSDKTISTITKELNKLTRQIEGYRSRLIARDQISKLDGLLTKKRQTEIGVDTYFWQTVGDERVRTTHANLQGYLCRWDDPSLISDDGGMTWVSKSSDMFEGHPGEDFQCRCRAAPNFEPMIKEIDSQLF